MIDTSVLSPGLAQVPQITQPSDFLIKMPREILFKIFPFIPILSRVESDKHIFKPTRLDTLRTSFISKEAAISLGKAHDSIEELEGLLAISQLSRGYRTKKKFFDNKKAEVICKVVLAVSSVQDAFEDDDFRSYRGAETLRECVDNGWYLKVLQLFFSQKPKALFNYATDIKLSEVCKSTILHNAVTPNFHTGVSASFVLFILRMDREHNLGLTLHKDANKQTPLQRAEACSRYRIYSEFFQQIIGPLTEQTQLAEQAQKRLQSISVMPFSPPAQLPRVNHNNKVFTLALLVMMVVGVVFFALGSSSGFESEFFMNLSMIGGISLSALGFFGLVWRHKKNPDFP